MTLKKLPNSSNVYEVSVNRRPTNRPKGYLNSPEPPCELQETLVRLLAWLAGMRFVNSNQSQASGPNARMLTSLQLEIRFA